MRKFNETHKDITERIVAEEGLGKSLLAAGLLGLGTTGEIDAKPLQHAPRKVPNVHKVVHPRVKAGLGISINNLGNIRYNPNTKWVGQVGSQNGFVKFSTPEYGVRALFKVINTYSTKYKLDTISKIITKFAPPTENNTASYIQGVSKDLGVDPDAKLNLADPNIRSNLVRSIIKKETGYTAPSELLYKGLRLSLK